MRVSDVDRERAVEELRRHCAAGRLDVDEYGREKLPPKAQRTWTKPRKGDQIGFTIHPRDGTIHEVVFRVSEPEANGPVSSTS